jgi:putative acetyltransferase
VTVECRPMSPRDEEALAVIAELDRYQAQLYPPGSLHLDPPDELEEGHFVGAFEGTALVGCGAVKLLEGYGEIKRVFVRPAARGRGVAGAIMDALEAHLVSLGVRLARLETGDRQPDALRFYRARGYLERGPFGAYRADPHSVFLERRVEPR